VNVEWTVPLVTDATLPSPSYVVVTSSSVPGALTLTSRPSASALDPDGAPTKRASFLAEPGAAHARS
jgi:hypothetical protein